MMISTTMMVVYMLLLLLSCTVSSSTHCNVTSQQYDTLYGLYTSTNGTGWNKICNNWIFSSPANYSAPCSRWYGITCNSQCNITQLNLPGCNLAGTIPSQLGYMTMLTQLDLDINSLTGTIPTQLESMSSMQQLYFSDNNLTGTIPTQLAHMTMIQYLYLDSNNLIGIIPTQLGSLSSIQQLYLCNNSLTGTIPTQLGLMTNITHIYLNGNSLTGTIPTQLGLMTNMTYLWLYSNSLTSTIPTQLGLITGLINLWLYNNNITGTIPTQLGSIAGLQFLILHTNSITGTIPTQLGSMVNMTHFNLNTNSLTGTIPTQLGSMTKMINFILNTNSLTGTIPSQVGSMTSMVTFCLFDNSLTGSIPSQIGSMVNMTYLDFDSNSLTGTIPSQLSKCTSVQYIYLQYNNLEGTVPPSILSLPGLDSIDLSSNQLLGGNLASLFNPTTTKSLQYIILSSMSLTGSLPSSLFSLPRLNTLVISSNCLTGTLPSFICNSDVSSLIVDGAGIGASCGNNDKAFYGSIPSCLLAMSNLTTLHLAGNGFTGTVPSIVPNSKLSVLSLTSNRLTGIYKYTNPMSLHITNLNTLLGDIPSSIQMHAFSSLDLSSNELSGTLMEAYQPPSSSLDLTVNRLSGKAPPALRSSNATVNVVQGNIFGCPSLHNDENSKVTPCGSSNLEYPFIAWLTMSIAVVIVAVYLSYSNACITVRIKQHMSEWWSTACRLNVASSNELYHTLSAVKYLDHACSMVIVLIVLFVMVVMMSFILIKQSRGYGNSLYQVQYLYITTSAYLVGPAPTVLLWLFVTISGLVVIVLSVARRPLVYITTQVSDWYQGKRVEDDDTTQYQDYMKSIIIRVILEIFVISMSISINYGFVRIVYIHKTSNLSAVNLAFAIIKYLVNNTVVPYSTKFVPKAYKQSHIVLTTIMVNVLGPGIAVLISSPLCLYDYIVKKSISANYEYPTFLCSPLTGCQTNIFSYTSVIEPEWFYSYQCSSSFLTSYLPNFIYLYIINGVLSLLDLIAMILLSTGIVAKLTYNKQHQSFIGSLVSLFQPSTLKAGRIFYIDYGEVTPGTSSVSTAAVVQMSVLDKRSSNSSVKESTDFIVSSVPMIPIDTSKSSSSRGYDISVAGLMPNLCIDTTMMLTFGLASPLFAVIVAFRIITNALLWRLALGRYISIVSKATSSRVCYEKLEKAFEDESGCLPKSWWMMSVFIGIFWSLFVFDMIGDRNTTGGIVAAVLMGLWCPCVFLSLQGLLAVNPDSDSSTVSTGSLKSIIDSIRNHTHNISLLLHEMIWKHVFRQNNSISGSNRSSSITETISPLGAASI